ncbi:MAG: CHAT domain-containing protein, partial [Bacteroidota bacterium]
EIYKKVMMNAIGNLPPKVTRLVIVPDGPLCLVPFETLLTDDWQTENDYASLPFLQSRYIIHYATSANLYFTKMNSHRSVRKNRAIAFAPTYSDKELAFITKTSKRGKEASGLIWNKKEVESIPNYFEASLFLDKEAHERQFKNQINHHYDIIHLAMHAIIEDEAPLNSRLVFSSAKDSIEDNLLHLYEIYSMKIPSNLVVLSACETGFGNLAKGEGIMNMGRAFVHAGSPNVIMSLWQVDDRSTSKLMQLFYEHLATGMSTDRALWLAKKDYLQTADPIYAHPYYWSGIILSGTQGILAKKDSSSYLIYLYALLAICAFIFFIRISAKKKLSPGTFSYLSK